MSRDPDLKGNCGEAWITPITPQRPDQEACLVHWFVRAPGYHVAWAWYVVSVIHLRDLPGMNPAKLTFPEATHEVLVIACDPRKDVVIDNAESARLLAPVNISQQFKASSDGSAVHLLSILVEKIVNGTLSPDSDYRKAWKQLLSSGGKEYVH